MTTSSIVRGAPNLVALLNRLAGGKPVLPDRARGVLTGLAVGNLLGLPVEGMSAASIAREYSDGVTKSIPLSGCNPWTTTWPRRRTWEKL